MSIVVNECDILICLFFFFFSLCFFVSFFDCRFFASAGVPPSVSDCTPSSSVGTVTTQCRLAIYLKEQKPLYFIFILRKRMLTVFVAKLLKLFSMSKPLICIFFCYSPLCVYVCVFFSQCTFVFRVISGRVEQRS